MGNARAGEQSGRVNAEVPALLAAPATNAFVTGLMADMPAEAYHAIEAMSYSGAKKMLQSPAHYLLNRTRPKPSTDDQIFGQAVHCGVLEPDAFESRFAALPKLDMRTTAGKLAKAELAEKFPTHTLIGAGDFDRARRCIDSILGHPGARLLLEGAQTEVSLFWNDGRYGVPCKCRWDLFNHGGVGDVKTIDDASAETFAKRVASNRWHAQAAHYLSGGEHVRNETPRFFAHIAVEDEPPHGVACYYLDVESILAGAHLMNRALERYAAALASGSWSAYPDTIEVLRLPRFALRFDV
jgi:hypothetical protein